jgi:hypothetical protein
MARPHDRGVGLGSSPFSFERRIADGLCGTQSGRMVHATAVRGGSVQLRRRATAKLHGFQETAQRGDDLDAIAVIMVAVTVFVFSIVGILTAITLSLYLTVG